MKALVVLALVAACGGHGDGPPPARAFYYWRTTLHLSEVERRALGELHVTKLYVRMFDVEWQDAPAFVGEIAGERVPEGIEVVPVVFVRAEVLAHPAPELARAIWQRVHARAAALGFAPHELQVDCDWTDKTQGAYFELLRGLSGSVPLSSK